jgi:hypothetical protein
MKYIFKISMLVVVTLVFAMNSCVEPDDLITSDAKEGGLVIPPANLLLKAGAGQSFDIKVEIPMGPGIESLELTKSYNQGDTLTSNTVVLQTISVASANAADTDFVSFSVDYASLKDGLLIDGNPMPADELDLGIGDRWTIVYTSVMADGRRVLNNATTVIAVSNKYAGLYHVTGVFNHPTAGPRDIDEDKFLAPLSGTECWTTVGDLGAGYEMIITFDPATNDLTVRPGANYALGSDVAIIPGTTNKYNPDDGSFELHYQYSGSGGMRVMDEYYTFIE